MPITLVPAPTPPKFDALGEAGDAYVASLVVRMTVHGPRGTHEHVDMPGDRFEALMTALRIRHLCFHPRTRGFVPNSMAANAFSNRVDTHWASVDSYATEMPDITAVAENLGKISRHAADVSWTLAPTAPTIEG